MEFLRMFLSPHFAKNPLVASQNDGCYLRPGYCRSIKGLLSKETVLLHRLGSQLKRDNREAIVSIVCYTAVFSVVTQHSSVSSASPTSERYTLT